MDGPSASPLTAIPDGWAQRAGVTSLRPSCVSCVSIGVEPNICPPHHPQDNCFVERFHRAYGEECLRVFRPGTEEEVREVTATFLTHYNNERPNQARSCGNRPLRVAFPTLPMLPALPEQVDPDG